MALFVLDTTGNKDLLKHEAPPKVSTEVNRRRGVVEPKVSKFLEPAAAREEEEEEDDADYFGLPPPSVDLSAIISSTLASTQVRKTKQAEELDRVSELFDAAVERAQSNPHVKRSRLIDLDYSDFNTVTGKLDDEKLVATDVAKVMQTTALVPGLEQLTELPSISERKRKKLGKLERSKTKGASWYNLPATEVTDEVRNDLKILQMRSVLDPKRFYKKNDLKVLPKYFQIGTVQHSPLDYYSERNTRHSKKRSLVDELLADQDFQAYNKRKYKEVVGRKEMYARRKAQKKMKKMKKNK